MKRIYHELTNVNHAQAIRQEQKYQTENDPEKASKRTLTSAQIRMKDRIEQYGQFDR